MGDSYSYGYGDRVLVARLVQRCRGEVYRSHPKLDVHVQQTRRDRGFYLLPVSYYEVEWPGLPIPAADDYLLEPDATSPAGIYVRLRRLDPQWWTRQKEPIFGIVVGQTWRCEGRVVPTDRYSGEFGTEVDEGYLADQRRVPLLQVALRPDGRARIAFAHPDDVKGA